jgi:spermidine/putrescine transport system ATP-binding protein
VARVITPASACGREKNFRLLFFLETARDVCDEWDDIFINPSDGISYRESWLEKEMLEIINLSKSFHTSPSSASKKFDSAASMAVSSLNLTIREGEFFSLLGPSGCGKTTLLRMIAGLEQISSGEIRLNSQRIDSLPAQKRPFNMVFQRYALFPHLTVFENVAFGLKLQKMNANDLKERVDEALSLVNMTSFRDRLPETLSGGQSQRVAIARALVNRPQILLLDEPLSALDLKLREHMQTELKELQRKLGLTFIYVTHDQEEALALSDRIGVMNQGRLEQVSEPKDLYDEPSTLFTAQFVGPMAAIQGEFLEVEGNMATFRFGNVVLKARPKEEDVSHPQNAKRALALIRPERLKLAQTEAAPLHHNQLPGKIVQKIFRGTQTEVMVRVGDNSLIKAIVTDDELDEQLVPGMEVFVTFDPKDTFLFVGQRP